MSYLEVGKSDLIRVVFGFPRTSRLTLRLGDNKHLTEVATRDYSVRGPVQGGDKISWFDFWEMDYRLARAQINISRKNPPGQFKTRVNEYATKIQKVCHEEVDRTRAGHGVIDTRGTSVPLDRLGETILVPSRVNVRFCYAVHVYVPGGDTHLQGSRLDESEGIEWNDHGEQHGRDAPEWVSTLQVEGFGRAWYRLILSTILIWFLSISLFEGDTNAHSHFSQF
ncbi:hypothetical protein BC827DRAFT_1205391 [Russula dissimulans]|nr:hypothetical protein BC827DRAFT_1205391 [Russula dissimulans]